MNIIKANDWKNVTGLTGIGWTRDSQNMNTVIYSFTKFELTSFRQTTLNNEGSAQRHTGYIYLAHIFLRILD